MAKSKEPQFFFDSESGRATCTLTDGNNYFIGEAYCCDEDRDMMSEKTGCAIALMRAEIDYYIHVRDNEIKPELRVLNQLYYSMNQSKKFNSKSYENRMLCRKIHGLKAELAVINDMLTKKKLELKEYLTEKENFYQKIRRHRAADSVGQN